MLLEHILYLSGPEKRSLDSFNETLFLHGSPTLQLIYNFVDNQFTLKSFKINDINHNSCPVR